MVENGTLPAQKLALTSIGRLTEGIIDAAIKGPAMILVGAHPLGATLAAGKADLQPTLPTRAPSTPTTRELAT